MEQSNKPLVIIADDNAGVLKVMEQTLLQRHCRVGCAANKTQLLQQLSQECPALLLLDLNFGEHNGIELLQELLQKTPDLTVVLLTGNGSIDSAVTAMKLGAYDYLTKPADPNRLQVILSHAAEKEGLNRRIKRLEQLIEPHDSSRQIWGDSPGVSQLREMIASVAPTDATVLILGESGTGKELVARALHDESQRSRGPFVPINMAALPRELVESTLFGHERGAFTGADRTQIGCCEAADKGTLFLDEIGDMDLDFQAKLLRFLQGHTFQRIGSTRTQSVDVRVIAATNRNLFECVRAGRFREDLYYRLNVVPLAVPPLRERRQDIPLLAARFLKRATLRHRKDVAGFTADALADLSSYHWPGNVRQLENLVERLVILSRETEIGYEHIPAEIRDRELPPALTAAGEEEGLRQIDQLEKRAIIDALRKAAGNVRKAAAFLGLGQATVYRKIKRYGLLPKEPAYIAEVAASAPA